MSNTPLLVQRHNNVVILVLNRPQQLNAIDVEMAQAFAAATAELLQDSSVRAVVLRGAGRAFGAGGDLSVLNQADTGALRLIEPMHRALRHLHALDAPVIAAVHGIVAGGSLSLALNCDLVLAADDACFNFAYTNVGASCDLGGSWALPRLVGLQRAMKIALIGESIHARQALEMNLISQCVPAEQLLDEAMAMAERLASGPTQAFARLRRLMRASLQNSLDAQLDLELEDFLACTKTADFREALTAFGERRQPVFQGH